MKAMNSTTQMQKIEYEKKIRALNMQLFKDITSSIVESDDSVTKEELFSIVSDKFDEVKQDNGFDYQTVENKIKSAVKSFIDKVNDSYFEIESEDENEKNSEDNI
jgi:pyridoxine 5'-phosphate synthase PdxJ